MSSSTAAVETLILRVAAAINVRALYPPRHPRVIEAVERARAALDAACIERRRDAVAFLLVDQDLVVDESPLRGGSVYQQHLKQALNRLGVEALTLARGLDSDEFQVFIAAMAAGRVPESTSHVSIGRVTVAASDGEGGEGGGAAGQSGSDGPGSGAQPVSTGQLDAAREAFVRFRAEGRGALEPMDAVVWSLMASLSRSTRAVLPVAPLKEHDEYTFVHSVNVSLLALAQARAFGLAGPMLHAIGLAALLHDIGKLKMPPELINKPGRLANDEWRVMMSHAEKGARHLAGLENVAPLSIVVAYEHHLRYDGLPNYPVLRTPRQPTLASQMTSLADTYDAITTARSYRKALAREVALGMLRDRAGTFFDPLLVGAFHQMLGAKPPAS